MLLFVVLAYSAGSPLPETVFRGIEVYNFRPVSNETLARVDELRGWGAQWTSLAVGLVLETTSSSVVSCKQGYSMTEMEAYFSHARDVGLRTMMRFVFYVNEFSRSGNATDSWLFLNSSDPDKFFSSMFACMHPFLGVATRVGVEAVAIGAEIPLMTTNPAYRQNWINLIVQTRAVYPGMLTYCSLPTIEKLAKHRGMPVAEWRSVPFWSFLDWIGIDAYFTLANSSQLLPDLSEVVDRYQNVADDIRVWRENARLENVPVVLTETGFVSSEACLILNGAYPQTACSGPFAPSFECQKRGYEATFQMLNHNADLIAGLFVQWMDMPGNDDEFPNGKVWACGYTPRGKPALDVLKAAFALN